MKTLVERQREEIAKLKARIVELEGLLVAATGAVNGSTGALLAERQRDKAIIEELTETVSYFGSLLRIDQDGITRRSILDGMDDTSPDATVHMMNLAVKAVIAVQAGLTEYDLKVIPLPQTIYQGSLDRFIEEVPRQIQMILAGIPAPTDFYRNPPFHLPTEKIGEILHDLAEGRLVSHDEYLARRLRHFEDYWQTVKDENSRYWKDRSAAYTSFVNFFDGTFKNWEARLNSIAVVVDGLTKPVSPE